MSLRRLRTGVVTAGAMLVAGLGPAAPAAADLVACGQIIYIDTQLEEDVGGCTNHGIVIGADGITLDLNGYTLTGTGATGDGAGVYLVDRTNVTVKGGKVGLFDAGIVIDGGSANIVQDIQAIGNIGADAVRLDGGRPWGDGILVLRSQNNQLLGNIVDDNGPFSGISLSKSGSIDASGNLVDDNKVRNNTAARSATVADNDGIRVEVGTTGNFISNNTVEGSALDGIALFRGASQNSVIGNRVKQNGFINQALRRGDGIVVFNEANGNTIRDNDVKSNAANGIQVRGPTGIAGGASLNSIIDNDVKNNSQMAPIASPTFGATFDLKDTNPGCGSNVWSGNWKNSVTRSPASCIF